MRDFNRRPFIRREPQELPKLEDWTDGTDAPEPRDLLEDNARLAKQLAEARGELSRLQYPDVQGTL